VIARTRSRACVPYDRSADCAPTPRNGAISAPRIVLCPNDRNGDIGGQDRRTHDGVVKVQRRRHPFVGRRIASVRCGQDGGQAVQTPVIVRRTPGTALIFRVFRRCPLWTKKALR
jgi:hypothetical protein